MTRYLPDMIIPPRWSMVSATDRTTKVEHREKLARDLEKFLAKGGEVTQLQGPVDPRQETE